MSAAPDSFAPSIAHLRTIATPVTDYRVLPFGIEEVDARLGAGGLRAGALHEATAQTGSLVDDAATTLFLAGIAAREAAIAGGPVLWASCRPDIYAPGLAQAGLTAASVIYAHPPDDATLLAVIEDAVRDGTPSAIVAEASKVSMVATRRLQLVAAEADMPVLLLRRRRNRDQDPFCEPSAAWTRWRIGSAPSARLDVAGDRLDDLVPIEPAAMEDRQIIEWDKDDIDALKFMKVDVLGLGMLGCRNRAFNMLEADKGLRVGLADLQDDDPDVYAMISKVDTLGTFQIESRAQMSMLPRMKPRRFYDLVIQVAIVRPGPIQGDMVHPYLRRREGLEKPE